MKTVNDNHVIKELQCRYPFVESRFESAAWSAIMEVLGQPEEWGRLIRSVRRVLEVLSQLTIDTLSLNELKRRISVYAGKADLHRILFHFLTKVKDLYNADDKEMFSQVIDYLENAGNTYYVLFNPDVNSFYDVTYSDYYNRRHFYVIRCRNQVLKDLIRTFYMDPASNSSISPKQERMDIFVSILDDVSTKLLPVLLLQDVNVPFFFKVIDEINNRHRNGRISARERYKLIRELFTLIRYCIRNSTGIQPYGIIQDLNVFFLKCTVVFFIREYISQEKTFSYLHWSGAAGRWASLVTLDINNPYLRKAYGDFLAYGKEIRVGFGMCRHTLVESLGEYADSVGYPGHPFTEQVLITQLNFYRELYKNNRHRSEAFSFVKAFYLFINEQTQGSFFRNCNAMTYKLVSSNHFEKYCGEGYEFRRYSPYDNDYKSSRIIFIISGINRYSRCYLSEDHVVIDYSGIDNEFYREIAMRATTSSVEFLYRKSFTYMLRLILPFLLKLKQSPGYPVPQLQRFSAWDALLIAEFIEKRCPVPLTQNHILREVRTFIRWCVNSRALEVDSCVFICLRGKKIQQLPTNTAVLSDEQITSIMGWFYEEAQSDILYAYALIITGICLLTPVRIGQLCKLSLEDLYYNDKRDAYTIVSSNKSSYGAKAEIVLGGRADKLILKAISLSESLRTTCPQKEYNSCLFLYQRNGMYRVFESKKYNKLLSDACRSLNYPCYTSKNLRATYMTKAYVKASEKGYTDDFLLKLFSYHRSSGTTLEYYVNHSEALAALSDRIMRGDDWDKTTYTDERVALTNVINTYKSLIDSCEDEIAKEKLLQELRDYEKQLLT